MEESLGLFKGKKYIINLVKKEDVVSFVKEKLITITDLMGLNINIEVIKKKDYITFIMYSDYSKILIGKNGNTLDSIQRIIRQHLSKECNININIIIDCENYKEKRKEKLIELVTSSVEEVVNTNLPVSLSNMNSYERRIVHNEAQKYSNIKTVSVGEEPNRYIIIELKEEDN